MLNLMLYILMIMVEILHYIYFNSNIFATIFMLYVLFYSTTGILGELCNMDLFFKGNLKSKFQNLYDPSDFCRVLYAVVIFIDGLLTYFEIADNESSYLTAKIDLSLTVALACLLVPVAIDRYKEAKYK